MLSDHEEKLMDKRKMGLLENVDNGIGMALGLGTINRYLPE